MIFDKYLLCIFKYNFILYNLINYINEMGTKMYKIFKKYLTIYYYN